MAVIVSSLVVAPSMAVAATPFTIQNFSPAGSTLAADQSGAVWFPVQPGHGPAEIVRLSPSGQRIRYPIPNAPGAARPQRVDVIATTSEGILWFQEGGVFGTITADGTVGFVPNQSRPLVDLGGGVIGDDGNLWFAGGVDGGRAIGRVTPAGDVTLFRRSRGVSALTLGSDGNVWFVSGRARIGRITPTGATREFSLPRRVEEVNATTLGPDGNVWFTAHGDDRGNIGRITTGGRVRLFRTNAGAVRDLTAGSDGRIWFTGWRKRRGFQHALIGRMTTAGRSQTYLLSDGRRSGANEIVTSGNGTLWVARSGTRLTVSRVTLRSASRAAAPAAMAARTGHRYDPPMSFRWDSSGKWRKAEMASRKCSLRSAYRIFSRSASLRRKGFAVTDLEQRAYFIRAIAVAYYANGHKATARRYVRRFVEVWETPVDSGRGGGSRTFGDAHFGDSLYEAYAEVGSISGGIWDPGEAGGSPGEAPRYDGDGDGDHNNPGDPCNRYND